MDNLLEEINQWYHTHGEYPEEIRVTPKFFKENYNDLVIAVHCWIKTDDTLNEDWMLV